MISSDALNGREDTGYVGYIFLNKIEKINAGTIVREEY